MVQIRARNRASVLLAAGCTTPARLEAVPPVALTLRQLTEQLIASALTRPAATSAAFDIEGLNDLLRDGPDYTTPLAWTRKAAPTA